MRSRRSLGKPALYFHIEDVKAGSSKTEVYSYPSTGPMLQAVFATRMVLTQIRTLPIGLATMWGYEK